ncbi:MAG: ABC transporter permease [Proteobacteria bacterium]|nr:ABC transporter permease [Pseudomonadota bacterium]
MLGAAIIKDTQLLLRDRARLATLFLLPVIFVAVFGSIFTSRGEEMRQLPVYHEPGDRRAAALVAALEASGAFHTTRYERAEKVRQLVAEGDVLAGLIIPPEFDPRAGKPAELAIDEGAPMQVRGPVEGAISGVLTAAYVAGPRAEEFSVLDPRTPPGLDRPLAGAGGFQHAVPGNAMLFGFFLALTVALSFGEERTSGTWRRLLAAPVSRPVVLLAKLVPWALVGLVQMAFLFGTGALAFGMQVAGSVASLCALTAAVVVCATALGLFIASMGGSEKQVGAVGSICLLVMAAVGGAMIPRQLMPETMQTISLATPHAWALEGYFDLLNRPGTTLAQVAGSIAALSGFAVVFATVGAWRFRFDR